MSWLEHSRKYRRMRTLSLCSPRLDKRKRPGNRSARKFDRSEPQPQALVLAGLTSRSLLELTIGITRRFIAFGISRARFGQSQRLNGRGEQNRRRASRKTG